MLIQLKHLVKEYDSLAGKVTALKGIDLAVEPGEFLVVTGKSGAGKTTFLRTIMGEIALDSGWCNIGETIEFGYYSQMPEFRDATQTVVDFVREVEADAKGYVGSYGGEGGTIHVLTMGRKRHIVNREIRKTRRGSPPVCDRLPPANFGPIVTLPPSLRPKFEGDLRLSHHIHSAFTYSGAALWDTASTA